MKVLTKCKYFLKKQFPLIIAHRGYCSLLPENTLASIEAAINRCDYV
jgi:glycerophosphoryl diester phosphodiesterase